MKRNAAMIRKRSWVWTKGVRMGTDDVGFRHAESKALQEYLVGTTEHST